MYQVLMGRRYDIFMIREYKEEHMRKGNTSHDDNEMMGTYDGNDEYICIW